MITKSQYFNFYRAMVLLYNYIFELYPFFVQSGKMHVNQYSILK